MVSKAALYLKIGLGLDFWANPIIDGSRNGRLASRIVRRASRSWKSRRARWTLRWATSILKGIPIIGWTRSNGLIMARNIERALARVDPATPTSTKRTSRSSKPSSGPRSRPGKKRRSRSQGAGDRHVSQFLALSVRIPWHQDGRFRRAEAGNRADGVAHRGAHRPHEIPRHPGHRQGTLFFFQRAEDDRHGHGGPGHRPSSFGRRGGRGWNYLSLFDVLLSRLSSAAGSLP